MFIQKIYLSLLVTLTKISPRLNFEVRHFVKYRKRLRLSSPQTFVDKLAYLALYRYFNDPLVIQCADKHRVRDYVQSVGCGDVLNDLIATYDSPKEIDWETLPNAFVMKWNFGCGKNVFCPDKLSANASEVIKELAKMGAGREYLQSAEMHYDKMPRKIICEKFLSDGTGKLPRDYKAYCFNGKVKCLLVMTGRSEKTTACFMSPQWNLIGYSHKYDLGKLPEKPVSLEKMIVYSEKLAAPFPFVRVDWYDVSGRLIFGEMTFTPAGATHCSQTDVDGKTMGELLTL